MPMRTRFVSRHKPAAFLVISLLLAAGWPALASSEAKRSAEQQSSPSPPAANQRTDPRAWFAKGQAALQAGELDTAETAFRRVLVADPPADSAYPHLGVIAMRRKDWDHAIGLLHNAEK